MLKLTKASLKKVSGSNSELKQQKDSEEFKLAPIVVFAYNRADKLKRLFETLENNDNTQKMDLYVFVDIPSRKNRKDIKYNQEVIKFLDHYKLVCKKFKNIRVEISENHKGLAESIISGVTKVINKYGKAIILEDDLEVSHDFLDYMQRGLEFYKKEQKIWALAGYSPEFDVPLNYKDDVFLIPRPESWGWGTWKNRWDRCDWQVKTYNRFKKDIVAQIFFDLGGSDLSQMLRQQVYNSQFDSWAIRWGYHQFLERKYTVYPKESRVIHCGNDSRSTHSLYIDKQQLKKEYKRCQFVSIKPNWRVIWRFRKVYSTSIMQRVRSVVYKKC